MLERPRVNPCTGKHQMTTIIQANLSDHCDDDRRIVSGIVDRSNRHKQSSRLDEAEMSQSLCALETSQNERRRRRSNQRGESQKLDRILRLKGQKTALFSSTVAVITAAFSVTAGLATGTEAIMFVVGSWSGHFVGFLSLFQQISAVDV